VIYIGVQVTSDLVNSNPEISEIVIDKQKLKYLQDRLENPHISGEAKNSLIKKIAGGFCSRCERIPTKIVSYDMGGAKLIEKYCDECFKKWDKL
jgi:hypothetical protein